MTNIITKAWDAVVLGLHRLHQAPGNTCAPCRVNCNQGRTCPLHTARASLPVPTAVQTSAPTPTTAPTTKPAPRLLAFEVRTRHLGTTTKQHVLAASSLQASCIAKTHAAAIYGDAASLCIFVKPSTKTHA